MAAANLCCTHPQQRTDSPEPPSRPLATIDGLFAAAILPEDHPNAPKFTDRKPEMDASIVRSPNMARKLKMQFRRKSMKSLSNEKDYDGDAHKMTSQEVLHDVEGPTEKNVDCKEAMKHHRFGSLTELEYDKVQRQGVATPEVRDSIMSSLEYLKPLIQKPSDLTISGEASDAVEIATRVAARQHLKDVSQNNTRLLVPLPKSYSSPLLLPAEPCSTLHPRRSRSECGLGDSPTVSKLRSETTTRPQLPPSDVDQAFDGAHSPSATSQRAVPTLHVQEPTARDSLELGKQDGGVTEIAVTSRSVSMPADNGVHLHRMDISEQLRSMSQLSDAAENESMPASPYPWNFHFRERSDLGRGSGPDRLTRQISSSGINSSTVPSIWGRVRSPVHDAASSVYSRPTSAGVNGTHSTNDSPEPMPAISADLHALFADWPLKPSASTEETHKALEDVSEKSAGSERRNKPLPPTPNGNRKDSGTASFVTATNNREGCSVKWLSPPRRTCSVDSSSTLTKDSKQSRFFEKFSPPKKLVRKRRSIFKFLRPASRKQQARSISSPLMGVATPKSIALYDGPTDDPALLTVQYELTEQPNNSLRSVSMSHLSPGHHQDAPIELPSPQTLARRPTLADYERKLTVGGDSRRRPSAVNINRVKEIQEEDRKESIGIRRKLTRANALKDDASPLMAQALEMHQQEKALFRSASKQRESLKGFQGSYEPRPPPSFSFSSFARTSSGIPSSIPEDHSDLLDPLEKGHFADRSERSHHATHLVLSSTSIAGSSRRSSVAATPRSVPTKAIAEESAVQDTKPAKHSIGTSLDSWSRYPSHTRDERCGSAGRADAVIARDFAFDINPDVIQDADEDEDASPQSKQSGKSPAKPAKRPLAKSRSLTFGGIVRYYSNLFHTSGFQGQNRRTSVTTGGRLEFPELEMLPPQLPADLSAQSHHHFDFSRLKEEIREDAEIIKDYVEDEEDKLEHYIKEEEEVLEKFVEREEHELEDFVQKEEHKFLDYVKDEENKFKKYWHHGSGSQDSKGRQSPFREVDVFGVSREHDPGTSQRRDTMIGPMEGFQKGPSSAADRNKAADGRLLLDGAAGCEDERRYSTPSKAEIWSDLYRECLRLPSTQAKEDSRTSSGEQTDRDQTNGMPPPSLKPAKSRSPEQPKQINSKATIRRFPSVTVIDDCKGHFRSVSLISVKTSRSAGFQRSSTHDLLELVQAREREEREKLLQGIKDGHQLDVGSTK
ncbi:hypothetical protein LTR37_007953 [Vermiconidia calcicola]|uniref:Uncharacterized protein n=1 Tax=Vermiconidia calcicola TaxID=1690605 RepID=A0ACC3NBW8_9PEZI|nr:hypothetical protein LTR37_007953 [Vermiconidia calcicola]